MTPKRETQVIIIGTIIGISTIVSCYLWMQNYLFPPGMEQSLKAFEKKLNEPDPFWDHYRLARTYFERGKHNLAVEECGVAMEFANNINEGMVHGLLFDIYLDMGDIANAEKELEWRVNVVRENKTGENPVSFGFAGAKTINEELLAYRRRLEELKKSQQTSSPTTVKAE